MPTRDMLKVLKDAGARLLRNNKHELWVLPDGRRLVVSRTASDKRAVHNLQAQIERKRDA
jgi:hypothetical protein